MKARSSFRILLLLALLLLTLCLVTSCGEKGGQPSDTSTEASTTPLTDAPTEPATETPTEPAVETLPETESETEEITTAEPEDLSLPSDVIAVFDSAFLGKTQKPVNGVKLINNLTRTPNTESADAADHFVNLAAKGSDPYVYLVFNTMTTAGRYVTIKYRTTAEADGQIFLGATGVSEAGMQRVTYKNDGEWHLATVDLYSNLAFSGCVFNYLRYDPLDGGDNVKGSSVDVAWIALRPDDGAPVVSAVVLPPVNTEKPDLSGYEKLNDSTFVRVSGEIADNVGTYTFNQGLTFDVWYADAFNRFTLSYDATAPIRGEITYLLGAADGSTTEYTEEFFLEAGVGMTFSSLIDGYLKNQYAVGIRRIVLSTCQKKDADFALNDVSTNVAHVYASGTYYFESDRYRLGVMLAWGGGISYIEDKQDGDESLTNLINNHDTGRLIQQSYYGIPCSQYSPATYSGSAWSYNPVQGGDQYGNVSKIVDFSISEDGHTVHVKARALDWAQKNMATPSYMENTYELDGDAILVTNRFVDFFGQTGPSSHQELPAFYVTSYLGDFSFYNGTKPWTGDDYTTLKDLPFWGGNGNAYHNVKKGNTETWAAWTSPEGYGIGLYVPGAEILLAGRHAYNGSKDGSNGATNYVAPLRTFRIVSFQPFEYSYVIAAGTVDEMRQVFADHR